MTIKEAADQLQSLIDDKMSVFTALGKKAKELRQKLDKMHLQMGNVFKELEPVEALVKAQHPDKVELFELLKSIAEKNS